jgi:Fur family iron response transcriptional regulator
VTKSQNGGITLRKTSKPDIQAILSNAGVRPTRQRLAIGSLLWAQPGTQHVEAAMLHADIAASGARISLATIYNTLREFERLGLVRRIAVASERIWFDTDTGNHQHFHIEAEHRLFDLPKGWQPTDPLPAPPKGYHISRVDTVVHLEKDDG